MKRPNRRRVLRATGLTTAVGLAGCTGMLQSSPAEEDDEDEPAGPPTVGSRDGDPDHRVTVEVTVEDESGSPVDGAEVVLVDSGGSLDKPSGRTGPNGRLVFYESVGPSPCNPLELQLPEYGRSESLGCKNGGVTLEHAFTVEASA